MDALDRHVIFQLDNRVQVLVPCGTIGEFPSLSAEERMTVAQRVVRTTSGRAAVLVGCGTISRARPRFRQSFPVIAAVEAPLPYTLLAGSPGLMTSTACFAPALMWEIFEAARAADRARLFARFDVVAKFRELFQPLMNQGYHAYIPFTKAACDLIGLPSGKPRPPHAPITTAERAQLGAVLQREFGLAVESSSRATS